MIKLTPHQRAAILQAQADNVAFETRIVMLEIEHYVRLGWNRGFHYGDVARRARLLQQRSADLYRRARRAMGSE